MLRHAIDLGIDHIDTSQYYGPDVANELIREALHPYPENLALVSKVGARRDGKGGWLRHDRPEQLREGIEDNLRTLDVERLAAVNLRLMDDGRPDQRFDDQLAAMVQARHDGLIGGIGLSNVTLAHLDRARAQTEIACVQNPFNILDRSSSPCSTRAPPPGSPSCPSSRSGRAYAANPVLGHAAVRGAAERLGHTPAQVVLAWTLAYAPDVLLIPGTSSVAHLDENTAVRDIVLPDDTREQLNAVAA